MRITMYCRIEMLPQVKQCLDSYSTYPGGEFTPIFNQETLTTENAQRTHFQGWVEISVTYDEYVWLQNYIA